MRHELPADALDRAVRSNQQYEDDARRASEAPISFQVLFVKNGEKCLERFESTSKDRPQKMREKFGLDMDNDKFALRSRGNDGRWSKSIGNPELCKELDKKR